MTTTHLSSKGQVIIPKSIRISHGWKPGIELVVIDTEEGILLKPMKPFARTQLKDVLGCAGYKGAKKTLKDMEKAIIKGAKKSKL